MLSLKTATEFFASSGMLKSGGLNCSNLCILIQEKDFFGSNTGSHFWHGRPFSPNKCPLLFQAVTGSTSPPESTDLETGKLPRVILGTEKPPRVLPFALPRLLLDGPYAAPSQDFARFKVIILIGAGIGVTPFASVVRECLRHLSPKDEVRRRRDEFSD